MKLEAQVVSLDLAKKLKALNVKQESLNAWCRNANYGFRLIPHGIGLTLEQYVQADGDINVGSIGYSAESRLRTIQKGLPMTTSNKRGSCGHPVRYMERRVYPDRIFWVCAYPIPRSYCRYTTDKCPHKPVKGSGK